MRNLKNRFRGIRLALALCAFAGMMSGRAWGAQFDATTNGTGGPATLDSLTTYTTSLVNGISSWYFGTAQTIGTTNSSANGFIELRGGFTISDSVRFKVGLTAPVGGIITFSGTGSELELLSDLHLTSTASIAVTGASCLISGQGNSIILSGDLSIPASKTLNIVSALTINGKGHTLTLGTATILAIASGITLTLKNMTLKLPAGGITWSGATSKLVLDNVVVELQADFSTSAAGLIDIYNFVLFRGYLKTFTDSLATANGLKIYGNSCLGFDIGTIFVYGPVVRTYLVPTDATSWLYLNGATLTATGTEGLKLLQGTLVLDNKVTLNTNNVAANGIILANTDVNVEILSGAQVVLTGYLDWYSI